MLNFENIKKELEPKKILAWLGNFFGENMKKMIFLLFFILSGLCIYFWYIYIFNLQWSAEKKMEYLKTKDKEIIFDRKKLKDMTEKKRIRAEAYEETIEVKEDIFRIE